MKVSAIAFLSFFLCASTFASRQSSGTIRGIVLAHGTNAPVARVRVGAYPGELIEGSFKTAETQANGSFTIAGLPIRPYMLRFEAKGYVDEVLGEKHVPGGWFFTVVTPGEDRASNIVMRMTPTGTIRGWVHDAEGRSMADVPVMNLPKP